jgi:hypothetical protein
MFWWMPFVPLFDPFSIVTDERQHVGKNGQSGQTARRNRPRPKVKRKAANKGRKKAASRKGAARKSARKKGAKRR